MIVICQHNRAFGQRASVLVALPQELVLRRGPHPIGEADPGADGLGEAPAGAVLEAAGDGDETRDG